MLPQSRPIFPRAYLLPGQSLRIRQALNAFSPENDSFYIPGRDFDTLASFDRYMRLILMDDRLPFAIDPAPGRRPVKVTSPVADLFQRIHWCGHVYDPNLEYAPHLELLLDTYRHFLRRRGRGFMERSPQTTGDRQEAEIFNRLIAGLRSRAQKQNVLTRLRDWDKRSIKNYQGLEDYLDWSFRTYKRLAVLTLDLLYSEDILPVESYDEFFEWQEKRIAQIALDYSLGRLSEPLPEEKIRRTIDMLQQDRGRFLKGIRSQRTVVLEHLKGFVWILQRSLYGRVCLRVALLFDGTQELEPAALIDAAGKYWSESITEGRGHYQVRYSVEDKLSSVRGIPAWLAQPIERDDWDRRGALLNELGLLAQHELLVRMSLKPTGDTYGKGHKRAH